MPRRNTPHLPFAPARLVGLVGLATMSACGGADDADISAFLSRFAAPGPVDASILQAVYLGALVPNVAADAALLLASTPYANTPATLAWLRQYFDPEVDGQVFALQSSGAAFAHAAGLTGQGQTIAMSDTRLSFGHEAFATTTVTVDSNPPVGDEHGTSVASVAVGRSANFIGVAPDAGLLFGTFETEADLINLGQAAITAGAVAWNNSWSYAGLQADQAGFTAAFGSPSGQAYLAVLDAFAAQGVVVFAVSNDTESHAGVMDALPFLRPSLEAGWIATANGVPTFSQGQLTSVHLLSSACLEAARWCLIADGSWNAAVGSGSDYEFSTGSSFAAPQVSGALALLAEAFPGLGAHDLRVRLLASAEDAFFDPDATVELAQGYIKGYSVTYGHGFLDIEAALKPIGPTALSPYEGRSVATADAILQSGTAIGDSIERALSDTSVALHDALGAQFAMPATALLAAPRLGIAAQKRSLLGQDLAAKRRANPTSLATAFADFSGPVMAFAAADGQSAAQVLLPQGGTGSAGVVLSQTIVEGPTTVDLGVRIVRDASGLTGVDGQSAATLASVLLGLGQDLGNGAFATLSAETGWTDLGGATVFGETGPARFDTLRFQAGQTGVFAPQDRLAIGLGLPIAITDGGMTVTLPVSRAGAAAIETLALDLAPEARQLDLELSYQSRLANGFEFAVTFIHSDNLGNRHGLADSGAAFALALRF